MNVPVYNELGRGYASRRQPDPRIAALIWSELGDARTVVNVGAGTGSYEPVDRFVQAVEPSDVMIGQRPSNAAPCIKGVAEQLAFDDGAFDAAMGVLTIHHWTDWRAGLNELRRVARRRVVLLTFDAETSDFWLTRDYFPALGELDRKIMPRLADLAGHMGAYVEMVVPVPHDCVDGFLGAYWRRPEAYLDPASRRSISSFARIDAEAGLRRLAGDLQSGKWHERSGHLLAQESLDVGYRILRWEIGAD